MSTIEITVATAAGRAASLALPVGPAEPGEDSEAGGDRENTARLLPVGWPVDGLAEELDAFLRDVGHGGGAGTAHLLPRPGREPGHLLLVGVGRADPLAWVAAGAALVRSAGERVAHWTFALPTDRDGDLARDVALGAWLAGYRFRLASGQERPTLRRITLVVEPGQAEAARAGIAAARALADAVILARDWTNTPSARKSPRWLADQIVRAAARRSGVTVKVLDEEQLAEAGFGGVLAVGSGAVRPPRLVELSWRPRGARTHVVLVGKGICFDSGGISVKPRDAMKLMRKDMGGAAAVCATVLAAADLQLPVRVTAVVPLAENLVSGSSMRPGDVIRHYGGATTEVLDTDAEGRLVLADALAYAARRLRPDYLIDLATLTGASHVALGKRTAALFSDSDELAKALQAAGEAAGEPVWRLPLADDYLGLLRSDVADLANIGRPAQAGAVTAALFLREFTGEARDRWAHVDMSAPSWIDRVDGPLVKGATGWGVRMLIAFLESLDEPRPSR